MSSCPGEERLMDALEGNDPPAREHADACPACRGRFDRAAAMHRALGGAEPPALSQRRTLRASWIAPAAALLFLAALLWTLLRPPAAPPPPGTARQESDVDRWVKALGDESPDVRREAEARLAEAGRAAEPALRRALQAPDPEVRGRARDLLANLPLEYERVRTVPSAGGFAFGPGGASVAYATPGGKLELASTSDGKVAWTYAPLEPRLPPAPAFSPDGRLLYQGAGDGKIVVLNVRDGTLKEEFTPMYGDETIRTDRVSVAFLEGGWLLFNDGGQAGICKPEIRRAYGLAMASRALASSDGSAIVGVTSHVSASIGRYDPQTFKNTFREPLSRPVSWMSAPRDLSRVYLYAPSETARVSIPRRPAGPEAAILVCDGLTLKTLAEHRVAVLSAFAVDPAGRWLAAGKPDGTVEIRRMTDFKVVTTLAAGGEPSQIAFAEDGEHLGVQTTGKELQIYRRR